MSEKDDEVEIIHRINHLKRKVVADTKRASMLGEGRIDPDAIERAQAVIDDSQDEYLDEVESIFGDLTKAWSELKS